VGLYFALAYIGVLGSFGGLLLGHTLLGVPYAVLIMSVAIRSFDIRIEQVAFTLGASWFTMFRRVLIPNLLPSTVAAWIFAFVTSFDEVVITTFISGTHETVPKRMFNELVLQVNPSITAIATLLIVLSLVLMGLAASLMRRSRTVSRPTPVSTALIRTHQPTEECHELIHRNLRPARRTGAALLPEEERSATPDGGARRGHLPLGHARAALHRRLLGAGRIESRPRQCAGHLRFRPADSRGRLREPGLLREPVEHRAGRQPGGARRAGVRARLLRLGRFGGDRKRHEARAPVRDHAGPGVSLEGAVTEPELPRRHHGGDRDQRRPGVRGRVRPDDPAHAQGPDALHLSPAGGAYGGQLGGPLRRRARANHPARGTGDG